MRDRWSIDCLCAVRSDPVVRPQQTPDVVITFDSGLSEAHRRAALEAVSFALAGRGSIHVLREGFERAVGALDGQELLMSPEEAIRRVRGGD